MKTHFGGRLFLAAVMAGGLALLVAVLVVAIGGRSVVAGPGAGPSGPVPNPGHAWTDLQGHGDDGSNVYISTQDDQALELRVNGARALRLEPNFATPNVIEGHSANNVTPGAYAATIGGGGASPSGNRVTDYYGTVGGGENNQAGNANADTEDAGSATVGGGVSNTASGWATTVGGGQGNSASAFLATVGGGWVNAASGDYATVGGGESTDASGGHSTVGGGAFNTASGDTSTVSGGGSNSASGSWATVAGGAYNTAAGDLSFAAGNQAKANNQGCFVWGDSSYADIACNNNDRFIARASGGVYLYTNSSATTGCWLTAGGNAWTCTSSDRNLKDNFTPVDGQEVLARLAEIPISTWNYKAEDTSIRHMGPMSQDLYAAFGLGEGDTAVSTVDPDGVALAAIQALYSLSQEQAARIDTLESENAGLQARVDDLETRVTALEGGAAPGGAANAGAIPSMPAVGWLALLGGLAVVGLVLAQRRLAGGRS